MKRYLMLSLVALAVVIAGALGSGRIAAEVAETPEGSTDPIVVSPDNYRLLLEDGDYRLLEMTLPAGTSDVEHSPPHEMVFFITGGKVRIHLPDGESMEAELPDGYAMKHEPWTHRVENIGETDIRAIIFERR